MKITTPGHRYELDNLKSSGVTCLQFYQDGEIHGGEDVPGTSCQEVIRALVDRTQILDSEQPHFVNALIIAKAREMLALFEARALLLKASKGVPIEQASLGDDGHILLIGLPKSSANILANSKKENKHG